MATERALQIENRALGSRDNQPPLNALIKNAERPPATLRSLSTQVAFTAALELEQLKKLLVEQDAVKRQAQRVTAQTDRQLRASEAGNSRIRSDLKRTQDQ